MIKIWSWQAISSGVIAHFAISVLATWSPSQESDRTEIWPVRSGDHGVHMYKVSDQ
jgi:hypothetical protein